MWSGVLWRCKRWGINAFVIHMMQTLHELALYHHRLTFPSTRDALCCVTVSLSGFQPNRLRSNEEDVRCEFPNRERLPVRYTSSPALNVRMHAYTSTCRHFVEKISWRIATLVEKNPHIAKTHRAQKEGDRAWYICHWLHMDRCFGFRDNRKPAS